MERKQMHQQTDTETEAASSGSNTAKRRMSGGGDTKLRLMPGTLDVDLCSGSQDSEVTIHQLPDLTLIEVFDKLNPENKASVARVCKRWRDLVYSPALWKHASAWVRQCLLSSATLDSLKRRQIRKLKTDHLDHDINNLRKLILALPSIDTLDAYCVSLRDYNDLAIVFPEAVPALKKLTLRMKSLDGKGIMSIAHGLPNISHLEVDAYFSQDLLLHIGILKHLKELYLYSYGGRLLIFNVPEHPEQMPCLTRLILCRIGSNDQMLHYLTQACPNLQTLTAILCNGVTDSGMQQLAQLKDLRVMDLGCVQLTLSRTMIAKLQNVHILLIERIHVEDEQLYALAQLPELEELEILCKNIREEGWRALGQGFTKLKCLRLNYTAFSEDTEMEHFGSLLSLEKIVFYSLRATDLQMKLLCSALKHVHRMTIHHGPAVTHDSMEVIVNMENLKEFCLYSTQISDEDLKLFANGKAPLETLVVAFCGVHVESILHIVQHKKSIRKLNFDKAMEPSMLFQIMKELPDLQVLRSRVFGMTRQQVQRLCPGLIFQCRS